MEGRYVDDRALSVVALANGPNSGRLMGGGIWCNTIGYSGWRQWVLVMGVLHGWWWKDGSNEWQQ